MLLSLVKCSLDGKAVERQPAGEAGIDARPSPDCHAHGPAGIAPAENIDSIEGCLEF